MDLSHVFDPLNKAQRESVGSPPGPILVLAGAGSGKTRALAHRIAWLIRGLGVSPYSILSVTFTNKAAREMQDRIADLLQRPVDGLWIGTFHGLCHRLLRMHWNEAGLPETFEIIDSEDQRRVIRKMLAELDLDEATWTPKQVQWTINTHKERGERPKQLLGAANFRQETLRRIYIAYEEYCRRHGLVDFAEILLRACELLKNNQTVRETYQERFEHVLVDEFQDTNALQYRWARLLSAPQDNLFAVGDDDQSIYGWRGAKIENILNFEKDFPRAEVFRLEQNYRSTGNILNAANAVIANNSGRLGKNLWTEQPPGKPIRIYTASNERDEADFVVGQIRSWTAQGRRRSEAAILYRSNAQSRLFEERLVHAAIPYRVYGGLRFFERAEIKAALAYLRLISSRNSDPSFERIVNLPARGIGEKTVQEIRQRSRDRKQSMWQAGSEMVSGGDLSSRAASALARFFDMITDLEEAIGHLTLPGKTEHVIRHSGLLEHYGKERGELAESRIENLKELVTATREFQYDEAEEQTDELSAFLSRTSLDAGERQAGQEDCVQLMTLHSAKGLEFPLVFMCGMEEGLFPSQKSIEEPGVLEEERRLCYVGMTRAMEQLFVCHAEVRNIWGKTHYTHRSRFLLEIPADHAECMPGYLLGGNVPSRAPPADSGNGSLKPGSRVLHHKFGEGTVIALEGRGSHARVQVNFIHAGQKWLISGYAGLKPV